MSKPKLLTWHDFMVPTGFSNVAKNLLKDAYKEYDVEIIGINYKDPVRFDTNKWFVYPTPDPKDQLGQNIMKKKLEEYTPDLIFLFQDMYNVAPMAKNIKKKWSPKSKIISYFPTDGLPISDLWEDALTYSDEVIAYSDWAIKNLDHQFPYHRKDIHKLYHGVDRSTFYPLPPADIKAMRKQMGWEDKFVVLNLNRFQPRKQIPLTLRVFSMFSEGYNRCEECQHIQPLNFRQCELCMSTDLNKADCQKDDVFLYLHMMQRNAAMGNIASDYLPSHLINAGIDIDSTDKIGLNGRQLTDVSEGEINQIYNAVNLNMTTTVGEGCGLSLLESAACGVQSLAPKHSAIPEMLGDTGYIAPNKAVFNMNHDHGHMRPIVDEEKMLDMLESAYLEWKDQPEDKKVRKDLVSRIEKEFDWQEKREKLYGIFRKALNS